MVLREQINENKPKINNSPIIDTFKNLKIKMNFRNIVTKLPFSVESNEYLIIFFSFDVLFYFPGDV